jgi:hypothetical protein
VGELVGEGGDGGASDRIERTNADTLAAAETAGAGETGIV